MGKTLSQDLRVRVIAAIDGGLSRNAAAARFGIAVSTAVRWARTWRETGATTARAKGGDLRSQRIEGYRETIFAAVDARADITLSELAELLRHEHGAQFAASTMWRFFARHGVTLKKTAHASEQDRPDVTARRQAWFDEQPDLDPERLVFIDETGASTEMTRTRGRARRGERSVRRCRTAIGAQPPSPVVCACRG